MSCRGREAGLWFLGRRTSLGGGEDEGSRKRAPETKVWVHEEDPVRDDAFDQPWGGDFRQTPQGSAGSLWHQNEPALQVGTDDASTGIGANLPFGRTHILGHTGP